MRAILLFLAFLWPSLAYSQITVPDRVDVHKPIVATLQLGEQIPEGAKVRGSWDLPSASWLPVCLPEDIDPIILAALKAKGIDVLKACGKSIHIWAPPGKHVITASGVWVLTRDVTIGEETFPVLVDFGQYNYNAEVLVGEDPNPPPPPPPPPPPENAVAVILEETDDPRPPWAAKLWGEIRQKWPDKPNELSKVLILDDDQREAQQIVRQVEDSRRPLMVIGTRNSSGEFTVVRSVVVESSWAVRDVEEALE